jgi:hypothetical protein
MKKNYFVGIDVSKQTLDVAFIVEQHSEKSTPCWKVFANNEKGLFEMKQWLQSNQVSLNDETLFVIAFVRYICYQICAGNKRLF